LFPAYVNWVSDNVDWATLPVNHAMNWATAIVSSITNRISTSSNVNWVIEIVDWTSFPTNHEINWASMIVNWVTKI
jgi:hypothetical protein